jgi:hypothetical protein
MLRIMLQGFNNHPDHTLYSAIPEEERLSALNQLREMLVPYAGEDHLRLIPVDDSFSADIRRRIAHDEHLRERQEAARVMEENLRRNPVVFQRDPDGGINLAAFAADAQSVHRSSVQNATHRSILNLMNRPLIEGQDALAEVTEGFVSVVRFATDNAREKIIAELTEDYFNTEAFSIRYGDALDHVWAFIRPHIHRNELLVRLAQEVAEGRRMCGNGKMARLVNVLQGYDETLEVDAPKELFQGRIALLMDIPVNDRRPAAEALFQEFQIPEEEREAWLEPLLEV